MKFCGTIIKIICTLGLLSGLVSCSSNWPRPSTGGYAGHYIFTKSYQDRIVKNSPNYCLSQRLASLTIQFQALRNSHARRCYPARFKLMSLLGEQIAQEIAAGLLQSAEYNLILFAKNLSLIRGLNASKGCPGPKPNKDWEFLKSRFK